MSLVRALAQSEGGAVWAEVRTWVREAQSEKERRDNPGLQQLMMLAATREG